jgi:hypothetical protein
MSKSKQLIVRCRKTLATNLFINIFIISVITLTNLSKAYSQCSNCKSLKNISYSISKDSLRESCKVGKNEIVFTSNVSFASIKVIFENKDLLYVKNENGICKIDNKSVFVDLKKKKKSEIFVVINNQNYFKFEGNPDYKEIHILFINGKPSVIYTNEKHSSM